MDPVVSLPSILGALILGWSQYVRTAGCSRPALATDRGRPAQRLTPSIGIPIVNATSSLAGSYA
jgi:hypothetical protein